MKKSVLLILVFLLLAVNISVFGEVAGVSVAGEDIIWTFDHIAGAENGFLVKVNPMSKTVERYKLEMEIRKLMVIQNNLWALASTNKLILISDEGVITKTINLEIPVGWMVVDIVPGQANDWWVLFGVTTKVDCPLFVENCEYEEEYKVNNIDSEGHLLKSFTFLIPRGNVDNPALGTAIARDNIIINPDFQNIPWIFSAVRLRMCNVNAYNCYAYAKGSENNVIHLDKSNNIFDMEGLYPWNVFRDESSNIWTVKGLVEKDRFGHSVPYGINVIKINPAGQIVKSISLKSYSNQNYIMFQDGKYIWAGNAVYHTDMALFPILDGFHLIQLDMEGNIVRNSDYINTPSLKDKNFFYVGKSKIANNLWLLEQVGGIATSFNLLQDNKIVEVFKTNLIYDTRNLIDTQHVRDLVVITKGQSKEELTFQSNYTEHTFNEIKRFSVKNSKWESVTGADAANILKESCITPKQESDKLTLTYNPLCQVCDKEYAADLVKEAGGEESTTQLAIKVPCKADVMLVTNTNFIKKNVINTAAQFKDIAINKLAGKQYPIYDSILLNWIDVQAKENRAVRYVEADNEDARKTFGYEFGTINDLPKADLKDSQDMTITSENAGINVDTPKFTISLMHVGYQQPNLIVPFISNRKIPIIQISLFKKGTQTLLEKKKLIIKENEDTWLTLENQQITFQAKHTSTLKPPFKITLWNRYSEDKQDQRALQYKQIIVKVGGKLMPSYIVLFGDYDSIPAPRYTIPEDESSLPLLGYSKDDEYRADDCFISASCTFNSNVIHGKTIARLPTMKGDYGHLALSLLQRSTNQREIAFNPKSNYIVASKDEFDESNINIANAFQLYSPNNAPPCGTNCIWSPPACKDDKNGCNREDWLSFFDQLSNANIALFSAHGNMKGTGLYPKVARIRIPALGFFTFVDLLLIDDFNNFRKVPKLVITGNCWGAKLDRIEPDSGVPLPHAVTTAFLGKGSLAYIGTTNVQYYGKTAQVYTGMFNKVMQKGSITLGEALFSAKTDITKTGLSIQQIALYGDPTIRIKKS